MGVLEILLALLGISVLVIIHELGHYLAARAFGMRVLRFSIGFGPTIFKYQPKGSPTTFLIGAIPFLAYVQVAGMNPFEHVDTKDPAVFGNKSLFGRMTFAFAGPFANYLIACVLAFVVATLGWPTDELVAPVTVEAIETDGAAAEAGLLPGDVIVRANGEAVNEFEDLRRITSARAGQPTEYLVERDGARIAPLQITPREHEGRGLIGVRPQYRHTYKEPMALADAAELAVVFPFRFTLMQIRGLMRPDAHKGLTGPVGMATIVAEQVRRGPLDYLFILVVLSIALGFFNLLPFPALDGGRLAFLGYEAVTRQRPNERFEAAVHMIGLLFLLGVLVLVTFRDIWG
ncbi:MAG: M50 family metallopeptidase [Myxococcales bacterium]|nr:M50 family metallopeptidase [Myxococcales bacterium]